MAGKKIRISRDLPAEIAEAFNRVARKYVHAKQQHVPMAAAMLMFLEASPEEQAEHIKKVLAVDIDQTARDLIEEARARQAQKVAELQGTGRLEQVGEFIVEYAQEEPKPKKKKPSKKSR